MFKRPIKLKFLLTSIVVLVSSLFFFCTVTYWSLESYRTTVSESLRYEDLVSEVLLDGLREPITQGAFLEVRARTVQMVDSGRTACAKLELSGEYFEYCPSKSRNIEWSKHSLGNLDAPYKGVLHLGFDRSLLRQNLVKSIAITFILSFLLAFLLALTIVKIVSFVEADLKLVWSGLAQSSDSIEQSFLTIEFKRLFGELLRAQHIRAESVRAAALLEVAQQVAHDIRSPISAINVLAENALLPEEQKSMMRAAACRLTGISDELLSKKSHPLKAIPIRDLIKSCLAEKVLEIAGSKDIEVILKHTGDTQSYKIEALQFSRVLSNIINNSIEALDSNKGRVEVVCHEERSGVSIVIKDSGRGICSEIVQKIGTRGFSFGKKSGSGLGISQAKEAVVSWGGTFSIESVEGVGTTVTITIPVATDE